MVNYSKLIGGLFIFFLQQERLVAQQLPVSQTLTMASADHLLFMHDHAAIYNGAEYVGYGQQIAGHPFFGDDKLKRGNLLYLGVWYNNIPLYYDLVSGFVLIQSHDGHHFLKLPSSKIGAFTYGNDEFVWMVPGLKENAEPAFFQQLHKGKVTVYAAKKKVIVASSSSDKASTYFKQFDEYFIVYGNEWTEVKSSSDLIRIFRMYKEPLRRWFSAQPLRYKKNPEVMLVQTAAFIETLIK